MKNSDPPKKEAQNPDIHLVEQENSELRAQVQKMQEELALLKNKVQEIETLKTQTDRLQKTLTAVREEKQNLEDRFRLATTVGKTDVWEYDLSANQFRNFGSLAQILGYSPTAFLDPEVLSRVVHPEDREWVSKLLQEHISGRSPKFLVELRVLHSEGSVHWILVRGQVVRNEQGKALRVLGTSMDITDRKQQELALKESENRFKLFARATRDAIYDWDLKTDKVWRSQSFLISYGYEESTEANLSWWSTCIHSEDREAVLSSLDEQIGLQASSWFAEYRFRKADHSYAHVIDRGYFFHDKSGVPVRMIGAMTDITDLKRAEEEKARMERKLLEVQKFESIGVLAGGIAHKFNNLLTPILGSADHLLALIPPDSSLCSLVEVISQTSRLASELVQQLLSYAGKAKFILEPLDLSQLLQEKTSFFQEVLPAHVTLQGNFADPLPMIDGDGEQIQQLVLTLLSNAAESLEDQPGTVFLRTGTVHADKAYLQQGYLAHGLKEGPFVFLEVEDTGCGIPETLKDKIFDPFFTTKFSGRGLGLAAALGILTGHKGAMFMTSEVGKGSRFRALFPQIQPTSPFQKPQKIVPLVANPTTVLVIEDEEMIRNLLREILEIQDYAVLTAKNGLEGLELFRKHSSEILCVILDVVMPLLGGWDTLKELRALCDDLPVILISAYVETDIPKKLQGVPAIQFLPKPFDPKTLLQAMRELTEKKDEG